MCAAEQSSAVQLVRTVALDLGRGKQCRQRERQEAQGEKQGQKLDLLKQKQHDRNSFLSLKLSPDHSQTSLPERSAIPR